jgi:hypothetical protein
MPQPYNDIKRGKGFRISIPYEFSEVLKRAPYGERTRGSDSL